MDANYIHVSFKIVFPLMAEVERFDGDTYEQ